jgi:hypothetical protein
MRRDVLKLRLHGLTVAVGARTIRQSGQFVRLSPPSLSRPAHPAASNPHRGPRPPAPLMRYLTFATLRVSALLGTAILSGCQDRVGECAPTIQGVQECVRAADLSVSPDLVLPAQSSAPMVLYIDRSGSMTGYLDAANTDSLRVVHRAGANFRTLLDGLLAIGGEEVTLYGFGTRAELIPNLSRAGVISQLFSQSFYNDNNTHTEDALQLIREDSARSSIHLLVTDGRRGGTQGGEAAIAQFQRMGAVASWWVEEGGIFAISASMAPFEQVRGDRAGCWQTSEASGGRCPLYVFAFLPAHAAERALAILDQTSQQIYAYPSVSDERISTERSIVSRERGSLGMLRNPPFVLGFRAEGDPNEIVDASVRLIFRLDQSVARFARSDSLVWHLEKATLESGDLQWVSTGDVSAEWVQPSRVEVEEGAHALAVPLTVRSYSELTPTLYRLRISSTGRPTWLDEYEAMSQGDSVRTYGISPLFTQLQPRAHVLGGAFVTVY